MAILTVVLRELKSNIKNSREPLYSSLLPYHIGFYRIV